MLEPVSLLEKNLDLYSVPAGEESIERIRALAEPFQGARVLHVNATAYGGGVAEHLATHVPLLRSAGLDAHWRIISGNDTFFAATKVIHNALQGMDVEWTKEIPEVCLDQARQNVVQLERGWDFVVIHDPQPAALLASIDSPLKGTKWIWRCHIDLTSPRTEASEFLAPLIEPYDSTVWTMDNFVPAWEGLSRVDVFPPSIDPLVPKNLHLGARFGHDVCRHYGVDLERPIMTQVSRFDPWKDPIGVIKAFRQIRDEVPGLQLVLCGSMAADDPEGMEYWNATQAARADDPDIHLFADLQDVVINIFQQVSTLCVQKSIREGFGLTVSESLWKERPVIGGRAGGITLQVQDGVSGYLVGSVEECAQRATELLKDPEKTHEMGRRGREHVRANFLATRELEDYLKLFASMSGSPAGRAESVDERVAAGRGTA
jgi:trehalose synthase